MVMPEAPMDEHHGLVPAQNHVWRSRKRPIVQSESQSAPVQERPDNQLGLRIMVADRRHVSATGIGDARYARTLGLARLSLHAA
jgi:hypothetical protein